MELVQNNLPNLCGHPVTQQLARRGIDVLALTFVAIFPVDVFALVKSRWGKEILENIVSYALNILYPQCYFYQDYLDCACSPRNPQYEQIGQECQTFSHDINLLTQSIVAYISKHQELKHQDVLQTYADYLLQAQEEGFFWTIMGTMKRKRFICMLLILS